MGAAVKNLSKKIAGQCANFFHIEHSQKVGEVIINSNLIFFFLPNIYYHEAVCKYKAIFTKNNFDCRFDNHNFT